MISISYPTSNSPILNVMMRAVAIAARSIIRDFGEIEHLQVSKKNPINFVSATNKKSERILKEELEKARPGYGFSMEKSTTTIGIKKEYIWIIDPLDGSNNFLHGVPHFSITVSLQKKKEIIAGVTYDPLKDEMFYAEKGFGAFMNQRRIRVSERKYLSESILATGSPYQYKDASSLSALQAVHSFYPCIRQTGSLSLDFAYVASGRLDGAWGYNLSYWDISAGMLMIREAGGCISNIKNIDKNSITFKDKKSYFPSLSITVTNFHLHKILTNLTN